MMDRMDNDGSASNSNILDFLLLENRTLKEELQDSREMIKMNKIEIDVLSKNNISSQGNKKYIDVIANYRTANENYQRKIQLLEGKIEEINSEKLILEQLNTEANIELKAREDLHRDRIESLQTVIKDLEKKVTQMEKSQRSYDSLTGFVERNKDIFNPTEQAIEFKGMEDQLKEQIKLLQIEQAKGKENEDNLLKINGILRHKVVTLQAKLAMPNRNLGEILDKSLKRLMMYFIETQKRLLTGQESDSEGQEDLELIAPELATYFGDEALRRQKVYNVPHLDLLKIRGSIANGNQKIKEELLKRNHLTKEEKIQRLEIELEYTRRELTRNLIDLREQNERRRLLQRICEELQARNELLTQSNRKFIEKLNKYSRKIKESKEKQMKFIELDETINDMSTTLIKQDNNLIDKQKYQAMQKKILPPSHSIEIFDSPEEYKIHLELLAKDLSKNRKVQNLEHMKRKDHEDQEEEWKPRIKRSTSNPFLYFNERREEIMEVNQKLEGQGDKMRMQQTEIFGGMRMGPQENLDDIDI